MNWDTERLWHAQDYASQSEEQEQNSTGNTALSLIFFPAVSQLSIYFS